MATYKKRGQKKSSATIPVKEIESESTTAEVFQTLDTSASKTEQLVSKYQKFILIAIVLVTISVLSSATNGSVAGGGTEVLAIFQN